ncbi:MAG TPA: acyl carrier protein [Acidimicrobiia bacterium]|nr:acyl carrier protein [Acidimicrobiia bacterium]
MQTISRAEAIITFIIENFSYEGPPEKLTGSTPLLGNEVIDSMGILQIIGFIEDEFDIEFGDDDLSVDNFATIDAIAELIDRKRLEA